MKEKIDRVKRLKKDKRRVPVSKVSKDINQRYESHTKYSTNALQESHSSPIRRIALQESHTCFHLGVPRGYPLVKISGINSFIEGLEALGITVDTSRGNHYKVDTGGTISKANVDSAIVSRLISNVLIPHVNHRNYKDGKYKGLSKGKEGCKDKVLEAVITQYRKYLSKPPIHVLIFSGDEDFIRIATQIESYSEGTIPVYFISHPCIANSEIKNRTSFINIEDILNPDYTPPWTSGTGVAEVDGNNYLNSLYNGGVGNLSNREDWPQALSITKKIFSKLGLLNHLEDT